MNALFVLRRMSLWMVLAAAPAVTLAVAPAGSTYKVVSGDTLDKVVRHTMGDSPLKPELLRQAFMQQNPQAFTKSSPRALMVGAVLTVPNHDDILRLHMSQVKQGASAGAGRTMSTGYATTDMNMNERKNWVRFP
jgi:Tfp pilus assembly protein FimV